MELGWISWFKHTLFNHTCCLKRLVISKRDRMFFNSLNIIKKETNIVFILRELRMVRLAME